MQPKDILLYYTAAFFVAVVIIMRKTKRKGMLLKLRGKPGAKHVGGTAAANEERKLHGAQPPDRPGYAANVERPLNVVFNYNGESWDAYEVLGLPAGSSMERVEQAHRESLQRVDGGAQAFMDAALSAIKTQWESYKHSKGS